MSTKSDCVDVLFGVDSNQCFVMESKKEVTKILHQASRPTYDAYKWIHTQWYRFIVACSTDSNTAPPTKIIRFDNDEVDSN